MFGMVVKLKAECMNYLAECKLPCERESTVVQLLVVISQNVNTDC